jgi:hypothetical protein
MGIQWSTASMGWTIQLGKFSTCVPMLAGLLAMQGAMAAPPLRIQLQARPQLDLRAPSHVPEVTADPAQKGFPSRRPNLAAQETLQLPALGAGGVRARPTIQEFVRRARQEGLPVARLFEGKSALVHLGLNPKGKPGLWLVQKTR